ncbi:hypothetical protein VK792_11590 [Mesobacterium sp. TK19101]|uniref:Uncharacterized protein n=1 Tax=Mesobacterium hydrothermale TaxID=3111907 RepID=A0ABU6HII5_9RHOB|nr:hypothetical protein [Mesobacterium sp. TK19101]MEC3861927.1 hypothetical protein [Mesobacterium sp. TK19101]
MALPRSPSERVQVLAACTGRLSARMEHQWLTDGPASEHTRALRDHLAEVLDLILPGTEIDTRHAFALRVQAKQAYAALLRRATFGTDPRERRTALRVAVRLEQECRGLLLGQG